jgi:hypothetical protein
MTGIRGGVSRGWKVVRLAIVVLAVSAQPLVAEGDDVPSYCSPQETSGCVYGGVWAENYYCTSWYQCETCCGSTLFEDVCENRNKYTEKFGDCRCGGEEEIEG